MGSVLRDTHRTPRSSLKTKMLAIILGSSLTALVAGSALPNPEMPPLQERGECMAWSWSSATGWKCTQEISTDPVDVNKFRQDSLTAQNTYMSSGRAAQDQAQGAVDSWYSEIKDYTFGKEPSWGGPVTGHFTQVVWKGSTEVGVGVAQEGSKVVVVANYSPPGNYIGQYVDNVPAPQ